MSTDLLVHDQNNASAGQNSGRSPTLGKTLSRRIYETVRDANNLRQVENRVALTYLKECPHILDVGCGTGNFVEYDRDRIVGIDANPDCVRVCQSKGLDVRLGDALNLPYEDNSFDGVYSAHVMHVFGPQDAVRYLQELVRVVKPQGVIAICTIPDNPRAWIHAENVRPYPPAAIRGLFQTASYDTETAPTFRGLPNDVRQEAIWFRRPALVEVLGHSSREASAIGGILNGLQYRFLLRKYWTFNGYIIKLRNSVKTS